MFSCEFNIFKNIFFYKKQLQWLILKLSPVGLLQKAVLKIFGKVKLNLCAGVSFFNQVVGLQYATLAKRYSGTSAFLWIYKI